MTTRTVDSEQHPGFTWAGGGGGGAIAVVLDASGRAFGWLCDDGDDGRGGRTYAWFLDDRQSGKDSDYDRARDAMGKAAAEFIQKRGTSSRLGSRK